MAIKRGLGKGLSALLPTDNDDTEETFAPPAEKISKEPPAELPYEAPQDEEPAEEAPNEAPQDEEPAEEAPDEPPQDEYPLMEISEEAVQDEEPSEDVPEIQDEEPAEEALIEAPQDEESAEEAPDEPPQDEYPLMEVSGEAVQDEEPSGDVPEIQDEEPTEEAPSDEAPQEEDPPAELPEEAAQDETPPEDSPLPGTVSRGEIFIELEKLKANPNQPRKTFDEAELAELADSIRQQGIIQPILAEDNEDGTYTIVAGERRTRAARLAGLAEVPVILRKYSEEKRMVVSLIENIQRANLNPIEEAAAYRHLMELESLSQEEAAAKVGKNRATVANALRLLKLPADMQTSIQKGELSPGHARAVLSVSGAKEQEALFQEILKKGLSVREAEKRAGAMGSQGKKSEKAAASVKGRAPELDAMEEKFIKHLGTKVVINGDLNKGTILVDYYSMEDLDRLYEVFGGR